MKLPSLASLVAEMRQTFLRFPFSLVIAVIGTVAALILVDLDHEQIQLSRIFVKIVLTCVLGLSFFLSVALFSERQHLPASLRTGLHLVGLVLLLGYYSSLPAELNRMDWVRFLVLASGLHFLVAFAAFVTKRELNGFWQFNKSIFLRILAAILFSGVLYCGLALAMAAIEHLFSVDIGSKSYLRLWIIIAGLFNTWFFLAGVPADFAALDKQRDFPKGLKVFTQYVLVPLVTIYLFILYGYVIKIVLQWKWPIGWVSYPVLGFSFFGILSQLLVYPIRDRAENKWLRIYARFFYWTLFPLIVLLFAAIWKRISDYGFTENRYVVLVLAFWLLGISVYLLLDKLRNIKAVPVSLFVICVLISFGPWSAFAVSKASQLQRLQDLLAENRLLQNGQIQRSTVEPPFEESKEISSIVDYLVRDHGYETLQPLFSQNLDSVFAENARYGKTEKIMNLMGLRFVPSWQDSAQERWSFQYGSNPIETEKQTIDIASYDFFGVYNRFFPEDGRAEGSVSYTLPDGELVISFTQETGSLSVRFDDLPELSLDLASLAMDLRDKYPTGQAVAEIEALVLTTENSHLRFKILFEQLHGHTEGSRPETFRITHARAYLFVQVKKDGDTRL